MKELTDALANLDARTILEVGCGGRRFLRRLAEAQPRAERLVGGDVVDPRNTVGADLLARPEVECLTSAGHELPCGEDSFDLVCIAHVLHHLQPDLISATLAEMMRVLRPGGTFLVYEMYRDNQTEAQMSRFVMTGRKRRGVDRDGLPGA